MLIAAGVLAYANSLGAPFVLDDDASIVRNPFIHALWPLTQSMAAPLQSSFAGRPIASLSLAISYAMGGLSPAAFRAWNLGVLVASALVWFGLIRRTIRRLGVETSVSPDWLAGGAALLWLLHPLQTELVDYVTQRTESMMGLCYLLTLYAAARAIDAPNRSARWSVIAVIACGLGMACKESMVTAPLMVLLYDLVFGARGLRDALSQRRGLYAGLAGTWLLLLLLNIGAPRSGSAGFSTAVTISTYLMNQAVMIVTYLKLSVWPHPLVLDYGRTPPITFMAAAPYFFAVTSLLAAVAVAWRHHRVLAFLGTWFFITLAPSSSLIPIASEVGAERRMHLPLAAIAILFVLGVSSMLKRSAIAVLLMTALALGGLTIARNREYFNPIGLWQGVLEHRPHGRAHYNLGLALKEAGRTDEALAHYRQAASDEPAAHYALGFEATQGGRVAESATEFAEFLRLRPVDELAPKASLLLGDALVRLERPADAERAYLDTLRLAPGYADARGSLADFYFSQQRYPEAVSAYREYLTMMPDAANAHHSLGLALVFTQRFADAVPEFEKAVTLQPANGSFRMSLDAALADLHRTK